MEEFWDADTETAPRAVDVYITKLRSKLADCNDFELKTVHGLGYKSVLISSRNFIKAMPHTHHKATVLDLL